MAVPYAAGSGSEYVPCSGLEDTPQCCAVDALGVASLDCANPSAVPTSADNFAAICGSKEPQCCALSLLGIALLCEAPTGTD
ncbi:hypothetical protein SCUCBS95973_007583 [Sporothrix curviconia]|uniref:Hydrophobin 2 n=1 Tax=Sporothrix curviconia TaxID=1260050 RepID=A0ABP0CEJ2_9PEZI